MSGDISRLLLRWREGDHSALAELMPIVYDELRRLGLGALRQRGRQTILEPTALVHEAWLRLVRQQPSMECRAQFYGLAAKVIRDVLVDQLRRRQAMKPGGYQVFVSLENGDASEHHVTWIF
jgi:RNA polymerase sigma factor (TIGR02999 family)